MAKSCFFISRIGRPESHEREFSDKLLQWIIEPALEGLGYEKPIRADHITETGVITNQVFTRLWNDDLVIADLTGGNPNVFYELAVRHLVRKPCVHLIESGSPLPFDVAPNRVIEFGFDIGLATAAKQAIRKMIEHGERVGQIETPLSVALESYLPKPPTLGQKIFSALKQGLHEAQKNATVSVQVSTSETPTLEQPKQLTAPEADTAKLVQPVLIERTEPIYPPLAKAANVQGTVRLKVMVNKEGIVTDSRLISGPPLLAGAAASAVHDWKYKPATTDGQPIGCWLPVEIRFTLPKQPSVQ